MNFRLQNPQDIVSRMILLGYIRRLDYNKVYDSLNAHQQKKMFYKFTDDNDKVEIDINWEYMFFEATMFELETIGKNFLEDIEKIDSQDKNDIEKLKKDIKPKSNLVADIKPKLVGLDGKEL